MLKARAQAGEAATQLLRLALDDSELRSALFLEQAALCFVRLACANVRKFAFYAVLAGNKYASAHLPRHTLRCFTCALHVYRGRGWIFAEVRLSYGVRAFLRNGSFDSKFMTVFYAFTVLIFVS